jgi:Zn finger protein HypA/HybF involved in hydrogenase expression
MPEQSAASASSVAEVKNWHADAKTYYGPWHSLIGKELAFSLDGQHYTDDNDSDPQRIKPVDPSLFNKIRYEASEILEGSMYYELRPLDEKDDPQAAEFAKAMLDQAVNDPESELEDALEDVVDGGLAARAWGLEVGFDPDCGPHGELTFESVDPRRIFWTPGFKSPHSKRCPWLIIEKPMLPAEIERMASRGWKNTTGVLTDAVARSSVTNTTSGLVSSEMGSGVSSEVKYATVLFCYERFVKGTKTQKSYRTLAPGDQHMYCPDCNFRGMGQKYLDVQLPETGDPCPDCGMPTQKALTEPISAEVEAYRKGHRCRVVAPYDGREFWNDRWDYDTRGFTTLVFQPYNHPINPIAHSDTYYYRSLACVSDAMLRLGYEQMRKAHGIILAPQDSLYDAYGEPFPFSEHRDVAYYDTDFLTPGAIQWFQPPGLNAAWSTYFQTVQGVFAASKGSGDPGLTTGQSKDIAVGTIEKLVETGSVATNRKKRRFQRFKSLVLTRAYEIMHSTMTTEKAVRVLGQSGGYAMQMIRASGLPGYDVVVTAEPQIAKMEMEKVQGLTQVLSAPNPFVRRILARALKVPPTWIAELEAMEAQAQQQQMMMQSGAQNGNPMAAMMGGANGAAPQQMQPQMQGAMQ